MISLGLKLLDLLATLRIVDLSATFTFLRKGTKMMFSLIEA